MKVVSSRCDMGVAAGMGRRSLDMRATYIIKNFLALHLIREKGTIEINFNIQPNILKYYHSNM